MSTSRSGAGGKFVTNRRRLRLSATPYDRPPPPQSPPPPPKSPNWFSGVIVPSARLIASGAGKIFSAIFTESEPSSSDEDSASDDFDGEDQYETLYNGVNMINEENVTSSEVMHHGQERRLNVWSSETKGTIEQLIMQETFSREECDKLITILNSRVTKSGEKSLLSGSPGEAIDNEDIDIYKAVQEAKKWFQEKKVRSSSVAELTPWASNLNSTGLEHVGTGGASPVDVARSYMKERPPWSSPTSVEIRSPMTTLNLFKERTLYSPGQESLSSSKKQNSLASGSWNIQEELRRVRSKATEDMLRSPSAKIDPSLFAVGPNRPPESSEASEELFGARKIIAVARKTRPIDALVDAGASSDHSLTAFKSRLDDKDSETVRVEGEFDTMDFQHSFSSNHAEGHHTGHSLGAINEVPTTEVMKVDEKQNVNVFPSSAAVIVLDQPDEENHSTGTVNVEGNCELLTEAYVEVPNVTEANSHEKLEKKDVVGGKQETRKSGRGSKRIRGKGR